MRTPILAVACLGLVCAPAMRAEVYAPTGELGVFLRGFERAFRAGDAEWIRTAVDPKGSDAEVRDTHLGILGPPKDGAPIAGLSAVAASPDFRPPNNLLDFEIESTLRVDFLIQFTRTVAGIETTYTVPAGYRDGFIWIAGFRRK